MITPITDQLPEEMKQELLQNKERAKLLKEFYHANKETFKKLGREFLAKKGLKEEELSIDELLALLDDKE